MEFHNIWNNPDLKHPTEKCQERLVSTTDEYYLKKGFEVLDQYFTEKEPQTMPNVLIFPETSARVLVYAVKSLVDYWYQKLNLKSPYLIFVKTQGEENTLEDFEILNNRIKEIYEKCTLKEGNNFLIVDDEVIDGGTKKSIKESICKLDPQAHIDTFAFFSLHGPKHRPNSEDYIGTYREMYWRRLNFLRNKNAIGVTKSDKNKAHVSLPQTRDHSDMNQLREELKEIGERFVEKKRKVEEEKKVRNQKYRNLIKFMHAPYAREN